MLHYRDLPPLPFLFNAPCHSERSEETVRSKKGNAKRLQPNLSYSPPNKSLAKPDLGNAGKSNSRP